MFAPLASSRACKAPNLKAIELIPLNIEKVSEKPKFRRKAFVL
jgi:hypothetical protein